MTEYRITKYDPTKRKNGIYQENVWTSISDIGKSFVDGTLSFEKYKKVEQAYIDFCITLMHEANISSLSICSPEYYDEGLSFQSTVSEENILRDVIMCCLREQCWVKLETENFFIHFGFDFYMYVGTDMSRTVVEETARKFNLFCEIFQSPYNSYDT